MSNQHNRKLSEDAMHRARRLWMEGLADLRIARALIAEGLVEGFDRRVAARICNLRLFEGWPQRPTKPWDKRPDYLRRWPKDHLTPAERTARRLEHTDRLAAERQARLDAALTLRRADPLCGYCDCARPGRPCVNCGRVAPGMRA